MNNILCEPSIPYNSSHNLWIPQSINHEYSEVVGGYGAYVKESIIMSIIKKSIENENVHTIKELNYNNYHFKNEDLKFDRDEINER